MTLKLEILDEAGNGSRATYLYVNGDILMVLDVMDAHHGKTHREDLDYE